MKKSTVEIIKPFGPMILKAQLPEELVNDLNQDCLDIADGKKDKTDWSDQLAGRVEEEYLLSQHVSVE